MPEAKLPSGRPAAPVFDLVEGSLEKEAAKLPETAPESRFEEIEALTAREKRSTALLALIPLVGFWFALRSRSHASGEKFTLFLGALVSTAVAAVGIAIALPGAEERKTELFAEAKSEIDALAELARTYRTQNGSYPDDEAWRRSVESADPRFYDPWGRAYAYQAEEDRFTIGTLGADAAPGGIGENADLIVPFGSEAVALPDPAPAPAPSRPSHTHVILDPGTTTCPTVVIGESARADIHGSLLVNGRCTAPVRVAGGGTLHVGERLLALVPITDAGIDPPAQSTAEPAADPFASLPPPLSTGSAFLVENAPLPSRFGEPKAPAALVIDAPAPLEPGIYWGGIRVTSGGVATLAPGLYVLAGGGLEVTGTGSVSGNGVTLYNTLDAVNPSGVGGFGRVAIRGSEAVSLAAPTSGTFAGIVLFQDRRNRLPIELAGDRLELDGVVYAPAAELRVSGRPKVLRSNLAIGRLTTQTSLTLDPPTQISAPRTASFPTDFPRKSRKA